MNGIAAGIVRLLRTAALLEALSLVVAPAAAHAQSWDVDLLRVTIDDRNSWIGETADRVPQGFGLAIRRVVSSRLFLELEASHGRETRPGAVCGGFIVDPDVQCIPELVRYRGSLAAMFVGWPGRLPLGAAWSIGARPRAGVGLLATDEVGTETGRSYDEKSPVLIAGLGIEAGYHVPGSRLSLVASGKIDLVQAFRGDVCLDCRRDLVGSRRQVAWGIGLRWRR